MPNNKNCLTISDSSYPFIPVSLINCTAVQVTVIVADLRKKKHGLQN